MMGILTVKYFRIHLGDRMFCFHLSGLQSLQQGTLPHLGLLFFSSLPYLVYLLHESHRMKIKYLWHGSTGMNIGYLIPGVVTGDRLWLAGILDSSWACLLCWVYGRYISPEPYVIFPGRAVNHFAFTASESRSIYSAALVMENFLKIMGENIEKSAWPRYSTTPSSSKLNPFLFINV